MLDTGLKSLNTLLGGGVSPDVLTQVYGSFATGKTTLAMQVGLLNRGKVAYVDTEGGFAPERLRQMAEARGLDPDKALQRFILFTPADFKEQRRTIGSLKRVVDGSFSLVVVDSITSHYRAEEPGRNLTAELGKQLQVLLWISRKNHVPVIVVNQVHFDSREGRTKAVAEHVLGYRTKDILRLDRIEGTSTRKATLERHRFRPEGLSTYFKITEKGLEEANGLIPLEGGDNARQNSAHNQK